MTQEELVSRIKEYVKHPFEDSTLELKSCIGGFPSIYDTLSSFSNQDSGGMILLGIDEKTGEICGVNKPAEYVKKTEEACAAMQPRLQPSIAIAHLGDKAVVGIWVPGLPYSQRPCYKFADGMSNGAYTRIGEADARMSPSQLYDFVNYSNHVHPDELPVNEAHISDLAPQSVLNYKYAVQKTKSKFASMPDSDFLENSGFVSNGKPTLAGLMTLAEYPQRYFRNFYISASVYASNEENARLLDKEHIDGNIFDMYKNAMLFVYRNMRHSVYFKGAERIDIDQYPDIALRELILNALLHRDYGRYAEGRCINLMVHPDKIVIASPGLLYGDMTLADLDNVEASREVRNPAITNAMEFLLDTENRGTGIRVARQAMLARGLKEPEFRQDVNTKTFLVTLRSKIERDTVHLGGIVDGKPSDHNTSYFG